MSEPRDPLEEPDVLDDAGELMLKLNERDEVLAIYRGALEELLAIHLQSRDIHATAQEITQVCDRFLSVPRGTSIHTILEQEGLGE